jgi:hypothetical protein
MALGEVGPAARPAFNSLIQAYQYDRSSDVQDAAAEALRENRSRRRKKGRCSLKEDWFSRKSAGRGGQWEHG